MEARQQQQQYCLVDSTRLDSNAFQLMSSMALDNIQKKERFFFLSPSLCEIRTLHFDISSIEYQKKGEKETDKAAVKSRSVRTFAKKKIFYAKLHI